MAPPSESCECYCLHCGRVFMSDQMWFQKVIGDKSGFQGFWMCPTPNCGGAGFTFDIFPTDPAHPANAGWHYLDTEDEEEFDEDAFDGNGNFIPPEERVYDPEETKYHQLDEITAGEEDMEGEEWKLGLNPADLGPKDEWSAGPVNSGNEVEDDEKQYDEPDRRPRELDWSDRDDSDTPGEDSIPY